MSRRRTKEAEKRAELWPKVFVARKPQDASGDGCFLLDWAMCRNETPISLYRGSVSQDQHFWATLFGNIKSTTPAAYLSCASPEYFAEATAGAHGRQIESKESNPLFSPAIFNPTLSKEGSRRRDNILYVQNIVLDFEKGDLLPQKCPNSFPICNSS